MESIHQLVNSYLWESDKVTSALSSHAELTGGGQSCREARCNLKLQSGVNS